MLEKYDERDIIKKERKFLERHSIVWQGMLCHHMPWYGMESMVCYEVSMLCYKISMLCYGLCCKR